MFNYKYSSIVVVVVDGEWGNWLPWDECSKSCGAGERVRRRLCDNPQPQFGGVPCEGDSAERVACNVKRCPSKSVCAAVRVLCEG